MKDSESKRRGGVEVRVGGRGTGGVLFQGHKEYENVGVYVTRIFLGCSLVLEKHIFLYGLKS